MDIPALAYDLRSSNTRYSLDLDSSKLKSQPYSHILVSLHALFSTKGARVSSNYKYGMVGYGAQKTKVGLQQGASESRAGARSQSISEVRCPPSS